MEKLLRGQTQPKTASERAKEYRLRKKGKPVEAAGMVPSGTVAVELYQARIVSLEEKVQDLERDKERLFALLTDREQTLRQLPASAQNVVPWWRRWFGLSKEN